MWKSPLMILHGHVSLIIEHIYVGHGKNYTLHLLLQRKIKKSFSFQANLLIFFLIRSIRIVGTHNTVNKVFHLLSMEVYYIQKPFSLVGDIYGKSKANFFLAFVI